MCRSQIHSCSVSCLAIFKFFSCHGEGGREGGRGEGEGKDRERMGREGEAGGMAV